MNWNNIFDNFNLYFILFLSVILLHLKKIYCKIEKFTFIVVLVMHVNKSNNSYFCNSYFLPRARF